MQAMKAGKYEEAWTIYSAAYGEWSVEILECLYASENEP